MPTEREAARLAREFKRVYPDSLPQRLDWWSHVLGIGRGGLLQLMGMSQAQVAQYHAEDWRELLAGRENQGWWLDGMLCELLSLFQYDWKSFSSWMHAFPLKTNGKEPRGESLASFLDTLAATIK